MKTKILAAALVLVAPLGCNLHKHPSDTSLNSDAGPSAAEWAALPQPPQAAPLPSESAAPSESSTPPAEAHAAPKKRTLADCKAHPTTIDFGDDVALEKEVRRKLDKGTGKITASDLGRVKSINLAAARIPEIDPCIFPLFSSLKDLFLGPGNYDDLSPIGKLTNLEALSASLSQVKSLHPIEGLKRMDRLDVSHTRVGDHELKSVGSLVNLTELVLDDNDISDLTPIANLKKLERLSIRRTRVRSLAPLGGLHSLKFLYIADTPVTDISAVQPLVRNGLKLIQN